MDIVEMGTETTQETSVSLSDQLAPLEARFDLFFALAVRKQDLVTLYGEAIHLIVLKDGKPVVFVCVCVCRSCVQC